MHETSDVVEWFQEKIKGIANPPVFPNHAQQLNEDGLLYVCAKQFRLPPAEGRGLWTLYGMR
jgi:hypothetical protein